MHGIDVHGLNVIDALKVIHNSIDLAVKNKESSLEVIHGYDHGNKIKNKVLRLDSSFHPMIISVHEKIGNNGVSVINLKIKVK